MPRSPTLITRWRHPVSGTTATGRPTWNSRHRSTIRWQNGLAHLKRIQGFTATDQRGWVSAFGATDHELVKEAIASTYGVIEMIDGGVASILAAVEALGQTEDTIVVFTSDHGDMMGEHGLMMKGFMPYRGTQQVPLVVCVPGRSANRSSSLASSVDLAPTILDLCDLPAFDGIQGYSLAPVLDQPSTAIRDHALIEDDCPPALAAGRIPEKSRTVVTQALRFTRNSRGEELLFDTEADPDELVNLANVDPVRRTEALEAMMVALLAADDLAKGAPLTTG